MISKNESPDLSGKQREIKFRIYIHSSKRMIDAVGFCYEGVSQIRIWYRKGEMLYNESFLIVDTDALQFTNLLDKNGKEIYEGDIGHWIDNNPDDGEFPINAVMVYQQNNAQFRFDTARYPPQYKKVREEDVEIIGNIYENPELIQQP